MILKRILVHYKPNLRNNTNTIQCKFISKIRIGVLWSPNVLGKLPNVWTRLACITQSHLKFQKPLSHRMRELIYETVESSLTSLKTLISYNRILNPGFN